MKSGRIWIVLFCFIGLFPDLGKAADSTESQMSESSNVGASDPAVTLQAPFIHPGDMDMPTAKAMGLPYYADIENTPLSSLAQPHRGGDQVAEWLVGSVSDILDTNADGYRTHLEDLSKFMDKPAVDSYNRFMEESQMYSRIKNENLHIHAFVEEKPFLLNKGVIDGRYRWLYDVPATLTFMKEDIRDYQNAGEQSYNYRLLIRMQIGRISDRNKDEDAEIDPSTVAAITKDDNQSGEGLIIETWEVRKNKQISR